MFCTLFSQLSAQNRVISYVEFGSATPVKKFNYGMAWEASVYVSPQVLLHGGLRAANQYPSGVGDLKAGVTVFPSKQSTRWAIENTVNFSNYAPYPMDQLYYRITGIWKTKHFKIDFGNAFAFFIGSGIVKYNLCRPLFCFTGIVRSEDKDWNVALFIRDFNRFEVHGSRGTEWGGEFSARVRKKWRVFFEPYVMTVGNFNGTSNYYNFNWHIGGAYLW